MTTEGATKTPDLSGSLQLSEEQIEEQIEEEIARQIQRINPEFEEERVYRRNEEQPLSDGTQEEYDALHTCLKILMTIGPDGLLLLSKEVLDAAYRCFGYDLDPTQYCADITTEYERRERGTGEYSQDRVRPRMSPPLLGGEP